MSSSARANPGCVVRAGESYQGKQGPNYTPGISAQSAGTQAIWLGEAPSTWRADQGPYPREPRECNLRAKRR
jgi:uncharacterized RmlC-like cupin family protein